jgi:CRP-like cAMP-binding protein
MAPYIKFVTVSAEREIIVQDELGDFMLVLLKGAISVVRKQEWGEVLVLANVTPGEMLGEMSLLDGGVRFSTCMTRSECEIAIITAEGLDQMIVGESQIAATLIALLARKLSLRLRVVSARLGGRKT